MRARLYTPDRTLGFVDLVDGADVADVVRAMREHRCFITPVEESEEIAAARELGRALGDLATILPGDKTIDGPQPKRRRAAP